jgi:nucleoid-associated protein YejK
MQNDNARYLTEKQVHEITQISLSSLRNQRFERRGIPFIKVNHSRSVRYLFSDVISYMERGRIQIEGASR